MSLKNIFRVNHNYNLIRIMVSLYVVSIALIPIHWIFYAIVTLSTFIIFKLSDIIFQGLYNTKQSTKDYSNWIEYSNTSEYKLLRGLMIVLPILANCLVVIMLIHNIIDSQIYVQIILNGIITAANVLNLSYLFKQLYLIK